MFLVSVLWAFLSIEAVPGHKELAGVLAAGLTRAFPARERPANTLIYLLGGTQERWQTKIGTAAALYRQGIGKKILFLTEPGKTAYDPVLRRNLTNQEWAARAFAAQGIPERAIEPVMLGRPALFGTMAEARLVRDRARMTGCEQLILVTSSFHTRRTWLTFTALLHHDPGVVLSVYASGDRARLTDLLKEYGKLLLYAVIVLPLAAP